MVFKSVIIICKNNAKITNGIYTPTIGNMYSFGTIFIASIKAHDRYDIHDIGFALLLVLKQCVYSCTLITARIVTAISITYLFPNKKIKTTIGNPINPEIIRFKFIIYFPPNFLFLF